MKKTTILILTVILSSAFYSNVFAGTPVVNSFNAPTSLESGQIANFGWTIDGGGHSLVIFCSQGIKLFYSSNNQAFPCDTRVSISPIASDGISIIVANNSGSPRIITARIIPKDGNAVDYDAGARETSIYINPDRQPITGLFSNATSTVSGTPTILSWTSKYLDGVNLKIDCNDSITATSSIWSGSSILTCGQIAFQNDLPGSGSVSILFNNQANADLPLNIMLIPAMSPGVYDGTHPQTLALTVASDAQKPLSVSFSASRTKIYSGDSVTFNWNVTNGIGANLKFSCSPYLQFFNYNVSTTTALPCNDYIWLNPSGAVGSTSVTFINSYIGGQSSTVTIFPELKNGTFAGYATKSIQISVDSLPTTASALKQPTNTSAGNTTVSTAKTSATTSPKTSSGNAKTVKNIFKQDLKIGSRNADVTLLQKFLAKNKSIYPEGYVTGYFGVSTRSAVGRFQIKNGLIKNNRDPLYGKVSGKTRELLNSMQ